jgi:hypothetical protein
MASPYKYHFMKGGRLQGDKRKEYMKLCNQMTSRDVSLDYVSIRDSILKIIHNDVIDYIHTLPDSDQNDLLDDINGFFENADTTDMNYIATINIISFQIAVLLTKYHMTRSFNGDNSIIGIDDFIVDNSWKKYDKMKKLIEDVNDGEYASLLTPFEPKKNKPIYLACYTFLTAQEMVETYLDGIFYCVLPYEASYIDGEYLLPTSALSHDIIHSENYFNCIEYPEILSNLKKFIDFTKNKEKPIQYSIFVVLFFFIHEKACMTHIDTTNFKSKTAIKNIIDLDDELQSLQHFGLIIPKKYRVLEKNSKTQLTIESVHKYMDIVISDWISTYKEFTKNSTNNTRKNKNKNKNNNSKYSNNNSSNKNKNK